MTRKYNVRVESSEDEKGFICWIDIDDIPTIYQPNYPHLSNSGNFTSESEARSWGESHVSVLVENEIAAEAKLAIDKEREEVQHQANLAAIETSKALQALVAHLANTSV